jgi:amino-acid N-acetyltransferase
MTFATIPVARDHPAAANLTLPFAAIELREAARGDVAAIHELVNAHVESDHLLPRTMDDIERRIARFVIATTGPMLVACAELAPLSPRTAEVRSMVVAAHARSLGIGRSMLNALVQQARAAGFGRLCAFTHRPAYFVRLGFSLVPHLWVREKITTDCVACPAFRVCGQHAVSLDLDELRARPDGARSDGDATAGAGPGEPHARELVA